MKIYRATRKLMVKQRKGHNPEVQSAHHPPPPHEIGEERGWTKLWEGGKDAKQLRAICKRPRVDSGPKLYNQISARKQLAVQVRLRIEPISPPIQHQKRSTLSIRRGNGNGRAFSITLQHIGDRQGGLKKEVGAGGTKVEKLLMHLKNKSNSRICEKQSNS
jgi:hypothetical protein